MRLWLTSAFLLCAVPVEAQSRLDAGLTALGFSASQVALNLTIDCSVADTCAEKNPVMARWLGQGHNSEPFKARLVKSAVDVGMYAVVWRGTREKPKTRTALLAVLAGIHLWDAGHNWKKSRSY